MTSVDDDAVPAVEAEMSECNCANEYREGEDVTHLVRFAPAPETVESLNRAVEEARRALLNSFEFDGNTFYGAVVAFEAAVSAKAMAEEREKVVVECQDCSYERTVDSGGWAEDLRRRHEAAAPAHNVWLVTRRARSSEEAGNAMPDLRD